MTLFRYFDPVGGIKTLENRTMRLASPLAFNDPFELTPRLQKPSDQLLFESLKLRHIIEDYIETAEKQQRLSRVDAENEYYAVELPKRFLNLTSDKGWAEKERLLKWDYVGKIAERFRILCCSHRHDSILMWSHYADKHRGIVIEFDPDEFLKETCLSKHALQVMYRSNPPTIPALFGDDFTGFEQAMNLMLSTKALEWSYEEEVRISFPVPDGLKKDEAYDQSFDPGCIKRVIVGCYNHADAKVHSAIEKIAGESDYAHVRFQRAYLDSDDYKLRFADRPSVPVR